jgi:hypothetical protein
MTMTNATLSAEGRGRPVKFTPEAIEKIKILVAQGASREEIASLLGVTLGSLQVTCSRLGISLRRKILHSGPTPDLPLNFHPAAIRASANVTPFGAVSVPA